MKRKSLHIYGYNSDIDAGTEDVWGAGGAYTWITTGGVTTIKSASSDDVSAGSGARTVYVSGLDSSGYEIAETATMNGTSTVNLAYQYQRINEAYAVTAGTGGINAGALSIQTTDASSTDAVTIGYVPASEGRSQSALYTVPADYRFAELKQWFISHVLASGTNTVQLQIRPSGGAWQTIDKAQIGGNGTQAWYGVFDSPYRVYPRTDIRLRAETSTDTSNAVVWGGFDIDLFD